MEVEYLLFAGDFMYPDGGARDFQSSHLSVTEAVAAAGELVRPITKRPLEWWHVAELRDGELHIVESGP